MFESYLGQKQRPLRARVASTALSLLLHGGAIAAVLWLSLLYVDELPEPQVTVTFFSAPPPPPPPPPPPAARRPDRPRPTQPKVAVKPEEVQPPDKPPEAKPDKPAEDDDGDDGEEGGEEGGQKGGQKGGTVGGVVQPKAVVKEEPKKPVFIPPQVGEKLKLAGEMPDYTPAAKMAKVQGVVIVKLCLRADGSVDAAQTKVLKALQGMDEEVLSKVRTWRYRPHQVNGVATPACFPVRFVFRLQ
ncbi:MAG: TonB family protein [Deltaproteobacteria bacterium]|nr:TonB family protein [Deltaproteobacteria bacterium]